MYNTIEKLIMWPADPTGTWLRTLWPEALAIIVSLVSLFGLLRAEVSSARGRILVRVYTFMGLLSTGALLFLGALWPSFYSIVAIGAIPSPFFLLAVMIRPGFLLKAPKARLYLLLCLGASAFLWAFQLVWELR